MKNEKITLFLLFLALIFLVATLLFLISYMPLTGNTIIQPAENQYSFTKAVCEGNVCQDFEIVCKNNQLIYQIPVSDKIHFSENWVDLRTEENKTKLC